MPFAHGAHGAHAAVPCTPPSPPRLRPPRQVHERRLSEAEATLREEKRRRGRARTRSFERDEGAGAGGAPGAAAGAPGAAEPDVSWLSDVDLRRLEAKIERDRDAAREAHAAARRPTPARAAPAARGPCAAAADSLCSLRPQERKRHGQQLDPEHAAKELSASLIAHMHRATSAACVYQVRVPPRL